MVITHIIVLIVNIIVVSKMKTDLVFVIFSFIYFV